MKFRWMVWNGMKKYVLVWKFSKITYWYILVCTGMTDITVYHGIWPFITVYDGMKWLKQVHTSTYKYIVVYDCFRTASNQYILVHTGTSLWHECTYFDQLVPSASAPGWPAWKQRICCFEKTHQFTHTHKFIQVWFWLFALPSPLASGGREKVPAVGRSAAHPALPDPLPYRHLCNVTLMLVEAPSVFT